MIKKSGKQSQSRLQSTTTKHRATSSAESLSFQGQEATAHPQIAVSILLDLAKSKRKIRKATPSRKHMEKCYKSNHLKRR